MAEVKTVYYTDKDGNQHSYTGKENDFRQYYTDVDNDFSFRENLIRSIYLSELSKASVESPKEMSHLADKSIIAADILLEKIYNMMGEAK